MAVVSPIAIMEVRRRDLRASPNEKEMERWAVAGIKEFAANYEVDTVVVEPGCPLLKALEKSGLKLQLLALDEAKEEVLDDHAISHEELQDHLLAEEPQLGVLVRVTPATNKIVMSARERNVQMLAVALGMGYQAAREKRSIRFGLRHTRS